MINGAFALRFVRDKDIFAVQEQQESILNIRERAEKAITYFTDQLHEGIIEPMEAHHSAYKRKIRSTRYIREVAAFIKECWTKVELLYKLQYRSAALFTETPKYVNKFFKTGTLPKSKAKPKGQTYEITLEMFEEGKTPEEIAGIRSMAVSTVRGHLSKWIREGKISVFELMSEQRVERIWKHIQDISDTPFGELRSRVPFEVSYHELRWVRDHYMKDETS